MRSQRLSPYAQLPISVFRELALPGMACCSFCQVPCNASGIFGAPNSSLSAGSGLTRSKSSEMEGNASIDLSARFRCRISPTRSSVTKQG